MCECGNESLTGMTVCEECYTEILEAIWGRPLTQEELKTFWSFKIERRSDATELDSRFTRKARIGT